MRKIKKRFYWIIYSDVLIIKRQLFLLAINKLYADNFWGYNSEKKSNLKLFLKFSPEFNINNSIIDNKTHEIKKNYSIEQQKKNSM